MIQNVTIISSALAVASVLFPIIAIALSKKGKKTSFLSTVSYICLIGFLLVGLYRIMYLAKSNNFVALINDITIRARLSVILSAVIVVLNFVPFITYKTPADAKAEARMEKLFKEREKAKKQEAEETVKAESNIQHETSEPKENSADNQ